MAYSNRYDITIHFESQREQDEFVKLIENSVAKDRILKTINEMNKCKAQINNVGQRAIYDKCVNMLTRLLKE